MQLHASNHDANSGFHRLPNLKNFPKKFEIFTCSDWFSKYSLSLFSCLCNNVCCSFAHYMDDVERSIDSKLLKRGKSVSHLSAMSIARFVASASTSSGLERQ